MIAAASLVLAVWLYLLFGRGFFWRIRASVLPRDLPELAPRVAVIVPARNEAALIGRAVASLSKQDYPGPFHIFIVNDHSTDGTAEQARAAGEGDLVTVLAARTLPPGWAGKVWAMHEGLLRAAAFRPEFILFAADIEHPIDWLAPSNAPAVRSGSELPVKREVCANTAPSPGSAA